MNLSIDTLPLLYDALKEQHAPVYLYGTGDGADKVLDALALYDIRPEGILVSDDFYRGQVFREYAVRPLSDAYRMKEEGNAPVILIAFGSHFPEMIDRVRQLEKDFPLYIPDVPVALSDDVMELFDKAYYRCHEEEILAAGEIWADDFSREVYRQLVQYKITGLPQPLWDCVSPKEEVFSTLIPLTPDDHLLDAGAYNGDTIREFLEHAGEPSADCRIWAFEPEPHSFKKLTAYAGALPETVRARMTLYHGAVGRISETIPMVMGRGRGSAKGKSSQKTGKTVPTSFFRVDDLSLTPTYVKMDVEGNEDAALQGMKETLLRCQPKLNIALYHRTEDLFHLPLLLKAWLPDHRFYLRRHACFPCWEVNLYAMPPEHCRK